MGRERSTEDARAPRQRIFRECPLEEATLVMARYTEGTEAELEEEGEGSEPPLRGFREIDGVVLPAETVIIERPGQPGWVVAPEDGEEEPG